MNAGQLLDESKSYVYADFTVDNIVKLVPADGVVIGSIGCGSGATEAVLVERGRQVHGVDVSTVAIERAKRRLTSARVVDPADELPFARDSLDGLILADVIEHLPLAHMRLRSYSLMVKKGGWVAISVPNMRNFGVLWQLFIEGDWPEQPMGIFDETHLQVMTHRRLQRWCLDAGLALDHWQDAYDPRFLVRNISRAVNLASFRLLKSFVTYQVQGLFRRF